MKITLRDLNEFAKKHNLPDDVEIITHHNYDDMWLGITNLELEIHKEKDMIWSNNEWHPENSQFLSISEYLEQPERDYVRNEGEFAPEKLEKKSLQEQYDQMHSTFGNKEE